MLINGPHVFKMDDFFFFLDQGGLQIEVGLFTTEQPMYTQEPLHYIMNKINLLDLILICQIYLKILEAINQKGKRGMGLGRKERAIGPGVPHYFSGNWVLITL